MGFNIRKLCYWWFLTNLVLIWWRRARFSDLRFVRHDNLWFQAKLSLNMLDSVRDYYQLALADLTRSGISTRRILLESISGYQTRDSHQLSQLAESIGARKQTLLECSRSRSEAEKKKELTQLVERLGRKPPEGEKYVSLDWVIKAGTFYELESSSDVCKGHNQMHKVRNFLCFEYSWNIFS